MPAEASGPSVWPAAGVSRVPYRVYTDPQLYAAEQERLFRGAIWQFVGFAVEVPRVGDFKTTWIGDTPVILVRSGPDEFSAFVNRCAHRGAVLCFEPSGHRQQFTCVYHNWGYSLQGDLKSVAFQRGIRGAGGMPDDFDRSQHNLRKLRVQVLSGLVFASFSETVAPLEEYLGERMTAHVKRMFARPVKVLGSYSQVLHNNWKLYMENVKDSYHASLLHLFLTTFKLNRLSMEGGLALDESGGHHISFSKMATDTVGGTDYESGKLRAQDDDFSLRDPRVLRSWPEFSDGITHAIQGLFPNMVVQQIQNSLAVRVLVPRGVGECELFWTLFGYEDDTPEQLRTRLRLANLIGPAGLVSMEDGIVGNFVQRAIGERPMDQTILEMGGRTVESQDTRISEASVRGFWQCYRQHMGL
ncbi:Rieske 2Fe-2S domain-containing protein [Ramlibacter sp. AW1]|uniref:Rieske 2Fe-2S domain-containing protein n=1 Tax=Ramlibacter aurantiacus TaxID=2801330 RepID=A0A937D1R5_9BURK|nr:SRPBCC family protein [Ramlibacter aurantiacus]MBL0419045.1 Rieske 2Fe-2S domain-containing protein [Ramlibacter aurantiacus]